MTMIICVIAAPSHLVAFLFIRETASSIRVAVMATSRIFHAKSSRDCEEAAKHASVSNHHHRRCYLHRESPLPGSTDSRVPDLKVANSELVKLVSLAFQASVMQHQQCTLGNNRAVAFERRNSANNVGTESSSGAKMPAYDSQTLQVLRC